MSNECWTVALFLRTTRWKHLKCTLAGEQINKMHHSHTVKYNVAEPQKRHAEWKKPDIHKRLIPASEMSREGPSKDRTQIRGGRGRGWFKSACERHEARRCWGDGKVWNWLCWRVSGSVRLQKVTRFTKNELYGTGLIPQQSCYE